MLAWTLTRPEAGGASPASPAVGGDTHSTSSDAGLSAAATGDQAPAPAREPVVVELAPPIAKFRFVDGATGAALPGLDVRVRVEPDSVFRWENPEGSDDGVVSHASDRPGAHVMATDACGELRLPVLARTTEACAHRGALEGSAAFDLASPPLAGADGRCQVVVEEPPGASVRVRVLDSEERPVAGQPVRAFLLFGEHWVAAEHRLISRVTAVAMTDSDGLAHLRVRDADLRLGGLLGERPTEGAHRGFLLVGVTGAFARPVEAPVRVDDLDAEAISLRVPERAALTVRVLDEAGRPLDGARVVVSAPDWRGDSGALWDWVYPGRNQARAHTDSDGVARLDDLQADIPLVVRAKVLADRYAVERSVLPLPPGSEQELVLRLAPPRALTGRVLRVDGTPLADDRLAFEFRDERGFVLCDEFFAPSDAEGRFLVRMGEDPACDFEPPLERARLFVRGSADAAHASVALADPPPSGTTDLGDPRLEPVPVAAEGTVVDAQGEPLPGATVSAYLTGRVPGGWEHREYAAFDPSARTDTSGRFSLRARVPDGLELELWSSTTRSPSRCRAWCPQGRGTWF